MHIYIAYRDPPPQPSGLNISARKFLFWPFIQINPSSVPSEQTYLRDISLLSCRKVAACCNRLLGDCFRAVSRAAEDKGLQTARAYSSYFILKLIYTIGTKDQKSLIHMKHACHYARDTCLRLCS